jgi:hypothetical protein
LATVQQGTDTKDDPAEEPKEDAKREFGVVPEPCEREVYEPIHIISPLSVKNLTSIKVNM